MSTIILLEALFMVLLIVASLMGMIGFYRTGLVLIGIAVINFVVALLSHFRWPVLRGDVSDLSPMNRQDSLEVRDDRDVSKRSRPSRSFVLGLVAVGVIALGAGILLMFLVQ